MKASPAQYDDHFRSLGATHRYDERYPARIRRYDGQPAEVPPIFARYYFNAQGTEIGYVIPDLARWHGPHIHSTPRVWKMPHTLLAISS